VDLEHESRQRGRSNQLMMYFISFSFFRNSLTDDVPPENRPSSFLNNHTIFPICALPPAVLPHIWMFSRTAESTCPQKAM